MLVRHNTTLLEQAIDLQVKRSAIPTLEAEAAAHDKIARANGFRRMATGAAIALAAVGIGIGAMLIFNSGTDERLPQVAEKQPSQASPQKSEDRVTADAPVERPLPPKQDERIVAESKSTRPEGEHPPSQPQDRSSTPSLPEDPLVPPNPVTLDFTKFVHTDVFYQGTTWSVSSGHQFASENSPNWEMAWCYTRRTVNEVDLNLQLVNRLSPSARPQAPVSLPATFSSVGLTETQARELASKCEWLDGAKFAPDDFESLPGRPKPVPFVVHDGWDALGHDLPNMPITNVSFEQCQSRCEGDHRCLALTYNKTYSACFMKGDATILIRDDNATAFAKEVVAGNLQQSPLVFAKNTVVVGNGYASVQAAYAECVLACAVDQRCAAFNFDANSQCTLLDRAISSADFKGVTSGLKATN